jgi:hypothetical protein
MAIRLFLELTGYPQLGNSTIHIAHLLWGGLALFAASIIPLVYANRWAYDAGAILAGLGVGLFIDEVGKFITQNNDYFFPPAAPIIYAFFLICVLFYLRLNKPRSSDPRTELYSSLSLLQEVLDRDLEQDEREEIESRLYYVLENSQEPHLIQLTKELLDFIQQSQNHVVPSSPDLKHKIKLQLMWFEARYLHLNRFGLLITIGLFSIGLFSLITSLGSLLLSFSIKTPLSAIIRAPDLADKITETWFIGLHILQVFNSLLISFSGILLTKGEKSTGSSLGLLGLLVHLTIIDLFLFYYYQFSTIVFALIQFIVFLALIRYRQRVIGTHRLTIDRTD